MKTNIRDVVKISPLEFEDDRSLEVWPGDLSLFAPMGFGLTDPLPLRPWENPISDSPAKYYEAIVQTFHPLRGAPLTEPSGGTIWFDGDCEETDVQAVLRLMGIRTLEKQYAAYVEEAYNPEEERCLVQLRMVSRFAMKSLFRALTEEESQSFPEQNLNVGELVWKFIEDQRQVWGIYDSWELMGLMGGDGDYAQEQLAFGLMVENRYYGVYRIWSRAWLVTK